MTTKLLPCGHDYATNYHKTLGCIACDCGAGSPVARRQHEEAEARQDRERAASQKQALADAAPVRAEVWNEDCIQALADRVPDNSIHLVCSSPPFEELFTYSGKISDVGNNGSTVDIRAGRFALNMRFVLNQLYRVLAPGCPCCLHVQQLLAHKIQHGFMGRRDFRGALIDMAGAEGFHYAGEAVIPKDPQQVAQRLKLHSLQFKTAWGRSATKLAPAPNDMVLIFLKPGDVAVPVRCLKHKKNPKGWITQDDWILWARGVWEINQMDILSSARSAKESQEEKHVCELQLEIIRRCIELYTNPITIQPDVTVLDPFAGIGSSGFVALGGVSPMTKLAVHAPRNFVGFELKESYHKQALKNVEKARKQRESSVERSLFDGLAKEV